MTECPLVTVVIPCRNERGWIDACLESLLRTTYPLERLEIIVVDGMSDDGTRDVVARHAAEHAHIRMLDNPARITPVALNLGIAGARGEVIVRMDAHNIYPDSYVPALVDWLLRSGADNVGGVCVTEPGGPGVMARAIAVALAHPAGVGNSRFRIGTSEPRWVDTVPFGCYRRAVFERIGMFDEDLVRNQDDELNMRLIRAGGRILLVPDVVSRYHARDGLAKLWRMYLQYGYFKPLVARKVGGIFTWRQLVPPAFVLAFVACALLAVLAPATALLFAVLAGSYALLVLIVAASVVPRHGPAVGAALCAVLPALHFSYGLGFLGGAFDFLILRRKSVRGAPAAVATSR
ncbi:MAG TPA: glycosyltransferase family 2 protein [Gemmatimonadaceae bacterium]